MNEQNNWILELENEEVDNPWILENDPWLLEEGFNLGLVKQGVGKGSRHHFLHQYLGWMIKEGYIKTRAQAVLVEWNTRNQPPLLPDDLNTEFEYCWSMWVKTE